MLLRYPKYRHRNVLYNRRVAQEPYTARARAWILLFFIAPKDFFAERVKNRTRGRQYGEALSWPKRAV